MKSHPLKAALALLVVLSLACNLQRVLDPSLPTSTPRNLPTASSPPTLEPTPVATLTNEARVEAGDLAFFYGDWDEALREYERTLNESQDDELRAAALLGMGRCYLEMENFQAAREALNTLLGLFPESEQSADAYFALAQIYQAQNNPQESEQAYQNYLDLRPGLIDSYVQTWRGDLLTDAGDYDGAIAAYQAALQAPQSGDGSDLQIKIANSYFVKGEYQTAVLMYQEVYNRTANDYLKADMDLSMGRAYLALGDSEQAYTQFEDAVFNYPLSYSSYAALVELVDAGISVDELQRGLVDYYAATTLETGASEVYSAAIAAFDRYLQSAPDDHNDDAHYFRALALQATADYDGAIQEFDHMIAEHSFDAHWEEAYSEKAFTQWYYQDDYEGAIDTLLSFVAAFPSREIAAEFLFTAGRIAEISGRLSRAVEIWPRVANEYPASEYAFDALFLGGITLYRMEDYVGAQSLFQRANQAAVGLQQESQSLFWIAKSVQVQGDEAEARNTWEQVTIVDPTGYYSERARDLLDGRDPFEPPENYSTDVDLETERLEAEDWIRSTFSLPAETDLSGPGPLLNDPRFIRGSELWKLGEYESARAEFEDLRSAVAADPANSYRLANVLIDLGLYRSGIFAAREVLNMAGLSDAATLNAPVYFNRLRFGTYYRELVEAEAKSEGLDSLFIYSVMRQESLFEGFITSSAGARGLMQIILATGEEVATLSGWPSDFVPDDLYRPLVSIRLGADYLAIQRNAYDGDLYAALAAYNAGPASASTWYGLADGDPDLFLEVIRFAETRNHIRGIYELFTIYRSLYSTAD